MRPTLIGVWSAAGQGRYVCSARYPRTAAWACAGRSVSAARVEQQVWDYVHDLLADKDLLRTRYEESRGDPAIQPREEQERERIERKLEAIGREVQRLIDAYQERILYSREHMRHKWSRIIDLLIVAMRFIKYAAIANPLNVTQCVVAVGAPRTGGFFCFIFRAHFLVVDAGQNMDTLAAERVLREGVRLVYNLITTRLETWRSAGCLDRQS
jgi:hypothetical protein